MAATMACARSIRASALTIAASGSASAIRATRTRVMPWVLGDFSKADLDWLEPLLTPWPTTPT